MGLEIKRKSEKREEGVRKMIGELSGLLAKKYLKNIREVLLKILYKKEQEQNVINANDARKKYGEK